MRILFRRPPGVNPIRELSHDCFKIISTTSNRIAHNTVLADYFFAQKGVHTAVCIFLVQLMKPSQGKGSFTIFHSVATICGFRFYIL